MRGVRPWVSEEMEELRRGMGGMPRMEGGLEVEVWERWSLPLVSVVVVVGVGLREGDCVGVVGSIVRPLVYFKKRSTEATYV